MDYTTLATVPISQENPAGDDVKYDDDFEKIESEIAKLSSPSESNAVDWELVAKLCEEILEHKSKNLLITVYLAYALWRLRGIDGLSDGIKILADLLENYWEVLYPPLRRIKGRINAVEWLLDKVSKAFENSDDIEIDAVKKNGFMADLKRVDNFLNAQLEEAPLFYNLIKLADMKLISPEETVAEEVPTPVQNETPEAPSHIDAPQTLQKSTTTHPLTGDTEQDFKNMVNELNILTGEMIEAQDYRSELFMINRAFAWLDIDTLPSSQKQITMLPPPDTQEIELLQKLYDAKDHSALLWASESRVTTYLFWLDLHYYVAASLEQLGFTQASEVILQQTRYFVQKLPELQDLKFSDTTPFASKYTKKWLSSEQQTQTIETTPTATSKLEDITCDTQGIDRFSHLIAESESVEQEVLYNIALCQCLSTNNNAILTKTYTKHLLERLEQYNTQSWRPDIALEGYLAAVACLNSLEEEDKEQLERIYEKIALLRPSLLEDI